MHVRGWKGGGDDGLAGERREQWGLSVCYVVCFFRLLLLVLLLAPGDELMNPGVVVCELGSSSAFLYKVPNTSNVLNGLIIFKIVGPPALLTSLD